MKFIIFLLMTIFAGCGDDSESSSECMLKGTLTGEVNQTIDWDDSRGCAGAVSGGLLTLTFGSFDSGAITIGTFGEAGVLANGVDGYVTYREASDSTWNSRDCLIDITKNEEGSDGLYLVGGQVKCSTPATPFGGDAKGEISYSPLDFEAPVPFDGFAGGN